VNTPRTIAFAGDWHGRTGWAVTMIGLLPDDVQDIIHVGDFGLMGEGLTEYVTKVSRAATRTNRRILVVPGNHENYTWLNKQPRSNDGAIPLTDTITVAPRGYRWTINSTSFAAAGGAVSVDKRRRVGGKSWWPQETITDDEETNICAGGHADILVTHDAPMGSGVPSMPRDALVAWAGADIAAEAEDHQRRVRRITNALTPRMLVHGHFHTRYTHPVTWVDTNGQPYDSTIHGLSCDGEAGNIILTTITDTIGTVTDFNYRIKGTRPPLPAAA